MDDTYALDGGQAATRWQQRHAKRSTRRAATNKSGKTLGRPRSEAWRRPHVAMMVDVLRKKRIETEITLEELGRLTGYNAYTIGRWERGEMIPSLLKLLDLAQALGMAVTITPKLS